MCRRRYQILLKNSRRDPKQLPSLQKYVSGTKNFMTGIKYLQYYPVIIFKMPSGLTIYKYFFLNVNESRGMVGDPHKKFTEAEAEYHNSSRVYMSKQYQLFKVGYQFNLDVSLLDFKINNDLLYNGICHENEASSDVVRNVLSCEVKRISF